jgi:hypothetical protein
MNPTKNKETPAPLVAPVVLLMLKILFSPKPRKKARTMTTTNEAYPWPYVTQIFRND